MRDHACPYSSCRCDITVSRSWTSRCALVTSSNLGNMLAISWRTITAIFCEADSTAEWIESLMIWRGCRIDLVSKKEGCHVSICTSKTPGRGVGRPKGGDLGSQKCQFGPTPKNKVAYFHILYTYKPFMITFGTF